MSGVLMTCSTDYQADESLAIAAVLALRDEPVRVLVTLADAYDGTTLPAAATCGWKGLSRMHRCWQAAPRWCARRGWRSPRSQ